MTEFYASTHYCTPEETTLLHALESVLAGILPSFFQSRATVSTRGHANEAFFGEGERS